MAISITEDVVADNSYRYTPNGVEVLRQFAVTGLDPTDTNNVLKVWTVSDATTGHRLPQVGDEHPKNPGIFVSGQEARPMGNNASPAKTGVWATVIYRSPEWSPNLNVTQVDIASVDEMKTMNRWPSGPMKGQTILVGINVDKKTRKLDPNQKFDPQINPSNIDSAIQASLGTYFDRAQVPVLGGGVLLRFTRREVDPPPVFKYKKKANATPWQSLDAGCWICRAINARKLFYPSILFEVQYIFQSADPDDIELMKGSGYGGFTQIEFFQDPETGEPWPGVTLNGSNNGYTVIDPYSNRVDFNALGLPTVY